MMGVNLQFESVMIAGAVAQVVQESAKKNAPVRERWLMIGYHSAYDQVLNPCPAQFRGGCEVMHSMGSNPFLTAIPDPELSV